MSLIHLLFEITPFEVIENLVSGSGGGGNFGI
jgi:hypothetical protein